MPLVRFEVRNEFGLGDPELYRARPKKDDPKAILDGVAVAGLVGILRQLGDLAEFASDIFHDLHEQVMVTSARGRKLLNRVQHLEKSLPSFENAIRGQRSHIHFAYVAGSEWHTDPQIKQSHLLSSDLPRFMMDSYEECQDLPRLYLLDKFDSAGSGACLKRYSDPSYFKTVWATSELEKAEKVQREKKAHKIKRKGSKLKFGEGQPGGSLSHRNISTQFAFPSTDEQHFSTEDIPISDMKLKPELASRSMSFGSRTRLNFAEQVPDTNASVVQDELENDRLSGYNLQIDQSGSFASDVHDKLNGLGTYDGSPHDSLRAESAHRSPSVTWDEKNEILKTASPGSCEDILVDDAQSEPLPESSKQSNLEPEPETSTLGTLEQGNSIFSTANEPATSSINHFDDITSETDNYMDALNTLESETETDSEYQTKREVKSFANFSFPQMENGISQMQEMASPSSVFSGANTASGSHSSANEDESPNTYNLIPSESLEPVHPPQSIGSSPDQGYSSDNQISNHNAFEMSRMSSFEGVKDDQHSEFSIRTSLILEPRTTVDMSKSPDSSPVNIPSVTSVNFWTNGGLLGLEPSKPPDFNVSNLSGDDSISGSNNAGCDHFSGLGETKLHDHGTETMPFSNEIISRSSSFIKKTDGLPNASSNQNILSGDQQFHRNDYVVPQIDPTQCSPSHPANQLDGMSVNQNSQRCFQALFSSESKKIQGAPPININSQNGCSIIVPRGAEFPSSHSVGSQPNESGQNTMDIASSISALAQRILANSLQRKPLIAHNQGGDVNPDISKPQDTSLLNNQKEGPTGVVSEAFYAENVNNTKLISAKNSSSSCSQLSGHSSPPLEHMKISLHPMNGLETSQLKLKYASGNFHDSIEDLTFPSFQLLPGPNLPLGDTGSETDDDTFCRSCPCTSEDHLSPRSDSNSELWGHDYMSGGEHHEMYDDLHGISLASSVSSFKGFDQMSQINPAFGFTNLEAENTILYFQNGNSGGLPGLDSLTIDHEGFTSQTQNEMPPPPPLPPMQWRMMNASSNKDEEKESSVAEIVEHFNVLQAQRSTAPKQQEQNMPRPPPVPGAMAWPPLKKPQDQQKPNVQIEQTRVGNDKELDSKEQLLHQFKNMEDGQKLNRHKETRNSDVNNKQLDGREELLNQIRNKSDQIKLNGQKEPNIPCANGQEVDEREELLHQIRNKAFNLRRTSTAKSSPVPESTTNVNVAAILEKANAIRQAFVGSDDGGDDDNWSE